MSITLHTDTRFPCPARLQLVIAHLSLPLKATIHYNILKAEQKTDELLRVNPAGSVPFIEDEADGQSLFLGDSRAISRYIVTRYGKDSGLIPDETNLAAYAKFEEAAAIEVASFDPAANPLALEEHFKPNIFGRETDQHLAQYHRKRLVPVLDLLNKKLANQAFMAGEKLTIVDFFYVPYMRYLVENVWPACVQERVHLSEWWARITKLDAYNAVFGTTE